MRIFVRAHAAACALLLTVGAGLSTAPASAAPSLPADDESATKATTDPALFCPIYPIALPATLLTGATANQRYERVAIGSAAGIAWLTWSDHPSAQTLERSLVPPGDSHTYVHPDNPADHRLDRGDWAASIPGNVNAAGVQSALTALLGQDLVLPVWSESRGPGGRTDYRVAKFALVRLTAAELSGQSTLSFDYLRDYRCYNVAPVAVASTYTTPEDTALAFALHATDANDDALSYALTSLPTHGTLSGTAPNLTYTPAANYSGDDQFTFTVSDGELTSAPATVRIAITPVNDAPVATNLAAETDQGVPVDLALSATDIDNATLSYRIVDAPDHGSLTGTAPALRYSPAASYSGSDSFIYVANDGRADSAPATVSITIRPRNSPECTLPAQDADHDGLLDPACTVLFTPPDPSTVAPPNDPTVATGFLTSFGFLVNGPQPIQRGVATGTIQAKTAAVLRGRVLDGDAQPLAGALVRVAGHPQFGYTFSRADGYYDLLVNGGGVLQMDFQAPGFIRAQRPANAPWQDFAYVEDVALVPLDSIATRVSFGPAAPAQLVRGSAVDDDDGSRQATLFVPAATEVLLEMHDGTSRSVASLTLRATEFTVGENGPTRMPAALPVSSGYTYAVELSADEAIAANAKSVKLSKPAAFYVDNFLGLPVGMLVPVGYYDYRWSAWRPSDNGRIVKIIGNDGGRAVLDVNGQGVLATADEMRALGIDDAERVAMLQIYAVGKELWRATMTHLTPWDCNFPFAPPRDAVGPVVDDLQDVRPDDEPEIECGSIIGCQNSSLGEAISVAGTPFTLRYQNDRSQGFEGQRRIKLTLKNPSLPASLRGARITWNIAGRSIDQHLATVSPGQTAEFAWDGKDVVGRRVYGSSPLSATVTYLYEGYYVEPAGRQWSFAQWSQTGIRPVSRQRATFEWDNRQSTEMVVDAAPAQLGGWSVDALHSYDMKSGRLARGDGTAVAAAAKSSVWAGHLGSTAYSVPMFREGDHVTQGRFDYASDVTTLPNGTLLVADDHKMWKIGADGILQHFAGQDSRGCFTRPCLLTPTDARLIWLEMPDVDVDKSGCVFALSRYPMEVIRICNGWAESLWGSPSPAGYGSMALADDGRLFVHDYDTNSIYQIDAYADAGLAEYNSRHRVAGVIDPSGYGRYGYSGNDGPAAMAVLGTVRSMAVAPDGALYLAEDTGVIRKIDRDGTIRRVAGRPSPRCDAENAPNCRGVSGVGADALLATINVGGEFGAFLPDGTYLFGNGGGILGVNSSGILVELGPVNPNANFTRCASTTANCHLGLPLAQYPSAIRDRGSVAPNGELLIGGSVVRKFGTAMPTYAVTDHFVADERGRIYLFDAAGRHRETRDPTTGAAQYRFEYGAAGLTAILDVDGQATTIERDAAGVPKAIIAPHGQRTELELDANGNLAVVRDPLRHEHRMTYLAGGLLQTFQRPEAAPSTFGYAADGRLLTDADPLAGGWTLDRTELDDGWRVDLTSAEGRTQRYDTHRLGNGEHVRITQDRDGSLRHRVDHADGTVDWQGADGSTGRVISQPDPRFGLALSLKNATLKTPSGKMLSVVNTRRATLADLTNPFSLRTQTDTQTVNNRLYRQHYDAATRTLTRTSPMSRTRTALLNADGKPVSLSVPGLASVSYGYDAEGRVDTLTQTADGQTRTTTFGYDTHGFVDRITDPLRRTTQLTNDALGRTGSQTLPDTRAIGFEHDARGNATEITPPGRSAHVFGYDDLDQLGGYAPPSVTGGGTGLTDYTYNRDKQLEQVTRPDGAVIDPQYDATTGQLRTLTTPEGSSTYTWLPGGRVDTISAPHGNTLDYGYDGPLLLSAVSAGAAPGTVSYTYDSNLWLDTVNAAGTLADYGYDTDGLLTSAKVGASTLTLTRNAQNGLLDGTNVGAIADTWAYTGFGEPRTYTAKFGTATQFSATYVRDDLGRIETRTEATPDTTRVESYAYDPAGRLDTVHRSGALVSDYRFDANGNREEHRIGAASTLRGLTLPCLGDLSGTNEIAILGQYDAQDRMTAYGTCTFAYTANGELTQRTDTATNATTTYRYDVFGNLRAATLANGTRLDYDIDGQNRRIGKRINGTRVQGFLYLNPLEPIAELDGNGHVVASFVYADRSNTPSLLLKGGKTYRIVADHLGSVRRVIDIATGAIAQQMDYDEYGNVVVDTAPRFQPFGYAGGIYDHDTGLTRFGARDYDPISGRWTAKDPLRFGGRHPNLYAYASIDPVNRVDLDGRQATHNLNLPGSTAYGYAQNYSGPSDEISLVAHGDRNGVWDRSDGGSTPLDAQKIADLITNHSSYSPDKPVRLLSCRSAEGPGSVAELLSKLIPNDVIGSEGKIQLEHDGSVSTFLDKNNNRVWDASEPEHIFTVLPGSNGE